MLYVDFADIFRDISVDLVCLYIFGYLLIYRRFENRDLFVTCAVFNIALMLVVMTSSFGVKTRPGNASISLIY